MAIEMAAIAEAAKLISAYNEQKRVEASTFAGFARILKENNEALIRDMSSIVQQAFSQAKLDQCNNTLQTLSTFFQDYAENPAGRDKLIECDHKAQYVMDILDDDDIAAAGIRSYLTAASLRISVLLLRSEFEPDALRNAVSLALHSIKYVTQIQPVLVGMTERRVGGVTLKSLGIDGIKHELETVGTLFLDGQPYIRETLKKECNPNIRNDNTPMSCVYTRKNQEERVEAVLYKKQFFLKQNLREQLPLNEITECSQSWQTFADSH
jgi:hypothetical protein